MAYIVVAYTLVACIVMVYMVTAQKSDGLGSGTRHSSPGFLVQPTPLLQAAHTTITRSYQTQFTWASLCGDMRVDMCVDTCDDTCAGCWRDMCRDVRPDMCRGRRAKPRSDFEGSPHAAGCHTVAVVAESDGADWARVF